MKKLKDILLEGYAWERKPGKPLPTLAEVQAEYLQNEAADAVKAKIAKLEKEIADLKHQYYSVSNLSPERETQLRKQMGEKGRELKRAKREDRTGSAGYNPNPERKAPTSPSSKPEPRWQDNDGDGKWYEPGDDIKEGVEEMSDDTDMDVLNMPAIDEYGDDETHSIHADGPKNAESDVREKDDVNETFWKRVKGNLYGHDYSLRESFRK
jgi:hypothetical protein